MSLVIKNLTKEELIDKYFEQETLINKLKNNIKNLSNELLVANNLFENSPTPMWEEDITDLINHIDELKKNGIANFREYLDENPNELIVFINKIKPINVNAALVKLHKAKSKEELLNNLDHVFIEEAMEAFKDEIVAIANGETSFVCLTKAKTLTNEKLDLELYTQITKSVLKSSIKYTAIVSTINITEKKKAEYMLVKNEKALRTILDTTDDIAILLDPKGFIIESNRACQEFYNVKRLDLIGRKLSNFATEEVAEKRRFYFRKALDDKQKITFENTAYNKIWTSTISPILDINGEVEKLVVFHKDNTSTYSSEKKLRDSELKYKSIFNNIQTSIALINNEGYITDINDYHIEHITKSRRTKLDYIGKNILERPSIVQAGVISYYNDLLLGKQFDIKNIYFPETAGGESAYFNIQGIPLFEDGKVIGAVITTEDVTKEVINKQKIVQIEQRLSLALEGAGIGFWEEDIVNSKILRSNHWFEMLGYQKSDFSDGSEVWRNLVHQDDLQNSMTIVRKHYSGEIDHIKIEYRLKNSQNNYQWILNWGKVIERDEQGNPIRSAGIHLDITELKKIGERNRYLAKLLDSSPLAYIVTNLQGEITDVNTSMEELTLYSKEELIGKNPGIFNAQENHQEIQKSIFENLSNNIVWDGEILNKKKNGELFYNHTTIFPLLNESGETNSYAAFNEDVTKRKIAEQALKDNEKYLKETQLITQLGTYNLDLINNVWQSSEILQKIFGIDSNFEYNIENWLLILHPEWKEIMNDYFFNAVIGNKSKFDKEYKIIRYNDKEERWVHGLGELKFDDNNRPITMVGTIRDITEKKNSEELLYKTKQQLELALKGSKAGTWDWHIKTGDCEFNELWAEIIGYNLEELKPIDINTWIKFAHPDDLVKSNSLLQEHFDGKVEVYAFESRMKHKSGKWVWVFDRGQVVQWDDEGKPVRMVGTHIDITERKKNEENLRHYEEIVSSSSDMLALIDKHYKYLAANKSYLKAFNLTTNELIDKTVEEVFGDRFFNHVLKPYADKCMSGEDVNYQEWFTFSESNKAFMDISYFPYRDDENNILGFAVNARDITQRIEIEDKLKESEEKFHKIFSNSPDSIILTKLEDGEIAEVNDATLKLTNIKLENLIGKKTTEILVWENLADSKRYIEKLLKYSHVYDFEANFIIKEGKVRNCLVSGEIIRINNIDYVLEIIRDVTDKKKSETALIESESKYRTLVENQSDLVVEVNKLNHFTFVSPSYCKLFGKSEKELLGKSFFPMIHEKDRALTEKEMKKLFYEPYTCRFEQRAMTARGWRWLEWNDTAQLDDSNNVKSILGVGRDITDKKESELALLSSEEKFYKIFKNSPDAIILTRMEDGEVIDVNDSTTEITGYKHSEIVGKKTTQIPLWSNFEDRKNYVNKLAKYGIAKSLIVDFIKKDGEKRIGMLSGVLLELNSEKFIFGILRDVTEKTIFEKKLQDTNERLRNLTRYMNNVREEERKNFAREVHDNLGQKLTALNLDISWIKQNIPDELVELRKQFDPVMELINQSIITVQKISTELRPGILDDLGLVNAIQWQSNEISRRTDLNFSLNLFKNEIDLADSIKTALFRVYQEALTNIVRHAGAKNVLVNLLVKEKKLIFEVIDDGKGISESDINEFTSFGIIGMKERIASINGQIVFSRPNKGTMLQIKVPIKE